jgi:hypothetical protein
MHGAIPRDGSAWGLGWLRQVRKGKNFIGLAGGVSAFSVRGLVVQSGGGVCPWAEGDGRLRHFTRRRMTNRANVGFNRDSARLAPSRTEYA